MNPIFTAGYAGRSVRQLVRAARAHNARIIDIRYHPESKRPEWGSKNLLDVFQTRYHHLKSLGNINYKSEGGIVLENPAQGIPRLLQIAYTGPCILICGCAKYETCHRCKVAELLPDYAPVSELEWPGEEKAPSRQALEEYLKDIRCSVALSVHQPWAWLLAQNLKDIENRKWWRTFQGPCLIHASKTWDYEAIPWIYERFPHLRGKIPHSVDLDRQGIVGIMHITGCVNHSTSPWYMNQYGFVLDKAKPLPYFPLNGMPSFFNPYHSIARAEQLKEQKAARNKNDDAKPRPSKKEQIHGETAYRAPVAAATEQSGAAQDNE